MVESEGNPPLDASTGSQELVSRFQSGDEQALERLWARYLPRLRRWAHGRLPRHRPGATDTDDLIQESFLRSLNHLRTLRPRGPQSLLAYFKVIILNQIRDYVRQSVRRPVDGLDSVAERHDDREPSPLEQLLGTEVLARYQRALMTLSEDDQQLVLASVELTLSDSEIAELFEKPSVNAARMARGRALARLGRAMETDMRQGPQR